MKTPTKKAFTSPLAVVIYICSMFASVAGGIKGYDVVVDKVSNKMDTYIEDYLMHRKGGFRGELVNELLAKGVRIRKEDIVAEYANIYVVVHDSINEFRRAFLPMLIEEKKHWRVGIYVNILTKRVMYLHTNGEWYRAFLDEFTGLYYFNNNLDQKEYCK